jgi:insecticidal toxin
VEDADQLKWFVAATGKLIQAPKSAAPQVFDVLGTLSHNNVLLHDKTDGKLRLLPKPKQTASLAYVLREGEVMVVEGQALKSGDLRPLVPDDVRTLVLRLGLGETTYRLSKTVLLLVDSVILDCQRLLGSVVTSPSKFIWELDKPDQLLLSKVDEHLVIIDPDSGRSVIGRDVFATDDNLLGDVLLSFGDDRHCELSFLISSMRALSDNQNGTTLGKVFAVTAVPTT